MGKILFIDAYDSFSNSIIALLEDLLHAHITAIKIDDSRFVLNDHAFITFLQTFDACVAGPGPGHPASTDDVGLIGKLWHQPCDQEVPILGICLGFQSLCLAFGATVDRLREPRHGLVTPITHCDRDVFAATGAVEATQYHSLHVRLGGEEIEHSHWTPTRNCKELVPLAWDLSDSKNGPILMAARHCHRPLWGVQYHPESICSNAHGQQIVSQWWQQVCAWNASHRASRISSVKKVEWPGDCGALSIHGETQPAPASECTRVQWKALQLPDGVEVTDIVDALRSDHEPILLESGTRNGRPVNAETGRFSIIGLQDEYSTHVYSLDDCEQLVQRYKAIDGPHEVPFWGGLVGYISYEAGLQTIDVPFPAKLQRPQTLFTLVERSVVVDHVHRKVYVQSIATNDEAWLCSTSNTIAELKHTCAALPSVHSEMLSEPEESAYCRKVGQCQSYLRAGDSYELCLTDQTIVSCSADPWTLYQKLRYTNPAPFGAYLCIKADSHSGVSLIGSSPERFLSWSREGKYQFRPIKGTVKKVPGMTRAKAEESLSSTKERAENLMIVDLIRHDLNGVADVTNVHVPRLLVVEEYETVYQLVSVIEGHATSSVPSVAALKASLPPGSMTGAPKKRSCELLLNEIEGKQARGLYSGVLGYFDVGGGGDFSVVIRSAFNLSEEKDVWRIGAGGAVTALSEPGAEWEEMLAKREAVLGIFGSC